MGRDNPTWESLTESSVHCPTEKSSKDVRRKSPHEAAPHNCCKMTNPGMPELLMHRATGAATTSKMAHLMPSIEVNTHRTLHTAEELTTPREMGSRGSRHRQPHTVHFVSMQNAPVLHGMLAGAAAATEEHSQQRPQDLLDGETRLHVPPEDQCNETACTHHPQRPWHVCFQQIQEGGDRVSSALHRHLHRRWHTLGPAMQCRQHQQPLKCVVRNILLLPHVSPPNARISKLGHVQVRKHDRRTAWRRKHLDAWERARLSSSRGAWRHASAGRRREPWQLPRPTRWAAGEGRHGMRGGVAGATHGALHPHRTSARPATLLRRQRIHSSLTPRCLQERGPLPCPRVYPQTTTKTQTGEGQKKVLRTYQRATQEPAAAMVER